MNLYTLDIKNATEGLKRGDFSCAELTKAFLDRIKEVDPIIKAFITVTEDYALSRAAWVDEEIKKDKNEAFSKYPLLGIPYVLKDNFSTKGILTTASSRMLDNYIPPFDSTVTARLNNSGAVLLGKTNMDAFAHGSSTEASDFFVTRNPWNINKVPGGSSGGSAAAVASDMCIFAIGSETGGSIRGPASWCGVTGFKPTYGRVSRFGVVAMASSTDSPGPITKTLYDSAKVLSVISGQDPLDATTIHDEPENYADIAESVDLNKNRKIRIGRPRSYFSSEIDSEVLSKIENVLNLLQENGCEIVDIDLLDPKYSISVYTVLQRSEVSSNLARLDGIRYGRTRENFGQEAKKRIMLGAYSLSAGYYDEYYGKAQKVRTLIINDFDEAFKKVDVIAGPTMPCVAMDMGAADTSPLFGEVIDSLNEPSSIAGLPGVTLPCGLSKELPVGVQFISNLRNEKALIELSALYQNLSSFHKEKPRYGY